MSKVMKRAGVDKPPQACRKFGGNVMKEDDKFKYYAWKFLAHSPKGMTLGTYIDPSDAEFSSACKWVGEQIGLTTTSAPNDKGE